VNFYDDQYKASDGKPRFVLGVATMFAIAGAITVILLLAGYWFQFE
jgi:hypothetical protein